MSTRPRTPDRRNRDGSVTITMQRHCNGCGSALGDVTDGEMQRALYGLPLPDVRSECDHCRPLAAGASQPGTCGRTRGVGGAVFPPCARTAGHAEAYCRSGDGALFLAAAVPAALTVVTDHAHTGPAGACDTARWGETCGRPAAEHQLRDGGTATPTGPGRLSASAIDALYAALDAVRALHQPEEHLGRRWCASCSVRRRTGLREDEWVAFIPWPCATVEALNGAGR